MSVIEILDVVLGDLDVRRQLSGEFRNRYYTVQYGESDFGFVRRIMREHGHRPFLAATGWFPLDRWFAKLLFSHVLLPSIAPITESPSTPGMFGLTIWFRQLIPSGRMTARWPSEADRPIGEAMPIRFGLPIAKGSDSLRTRFACGKRGSMMATSADRQDGCSDFRRLPRRELLTVGALTGMGLTLPGLFAARAAAESAGRVPTFGRAKSVIMLYLHGGHPQQETFDPKPEAPSATRGEFGDIATSLAGVRFCELFPQTAALAHKLAVIRSMSHDNPIHTQASLPAMSGHSMPESFRTLGDFQPDGSDFPHFGAVLDKFDARRRKMPTWFQVGPLMTRSNGTVLHGQLPGFLGARHGPFVIDQDLRADEVEIKSVAPKPELPALRLTSRRRLLQQIDAQRAELNATAEARTLDGYYDKTFDLLSSDATRRAFALSEEPTRVRDRYGRTRFGQSCLLARRLAEAGAPMIAVHFCKTPSGSWDTHSRNFEKMKDLLAPVFDQAFGALVGDLDERGMLDETLVFVNAEFGRTPKINRNAGRDHWPWVYSLALAGAGVKAGLVYGSSDRMAAFPTADPHDQADMAATLYHLLGVPPDTTLHDAQQRPHRLVLGKKIDALLA